MAYDAARHEFVLFGGFASDSSDAALADTWVFDGTSWRRLSPVASPPARGAAVLGWDGSQLVLFGGQTKPGGGQWLDDTWTWDGQVWLEQHPTVAPPARSSAVATYDGAGLLLFGGWDAADGPGATGDYGDTWRFTASSQWTQLSDVGPSPRQHASMTGLPGGDVLLYGGAGQMDHNDTWRWHRGQWTRSAQDCFSPSCSPPAAGGLAFDGLAPVLFTGYNGTRTWRLVNNSWEPYRSATQPTARSGAAFAGDTSGRVVLFGGEDLNTNRMLTDTWSWSAPPLSVQSGPRRIAPSARPAASGAPSQQPSTGARVRSGQRPISRPPLTAHPSSGAAPDRSPSPSGEIDDAQAGGSAAGGGLARLFGVLVLLVSALAWWRARRSSQPATTRRIK